MPEEYCPWEPFGGAFYEFAIILPIFITLQLILLINTIYHEYQMKNKHVSDSKTKISLRISFITLQLIGLYFTFIDILRWIIDPLTLILRDNAFCGIVAYSPKIVGVAYYGIYIHHILLRLYVSFKGSFLSISIPLKTLLSAVILATVVVTTILIFYYGESACIWSWNPVDINNDNMNLAVCDFHTFGVTNTVIIIAIIWTVILNISFSVTFTVKLKKILSTTNNNLSFKFKSLVVKNTILTVIGCTSTLLCYVLWITVPQNISGIGASFVYIDLFVNCLVIALMFRRNEKYYKILCKCCIVTCFTKFDQTYDQNDEKQAQKRKDKIHHYLKKHSIFSSTSNALQDISRMNSEDIDSMQNKIELDNVRTLTVNTGDADGGDNIINITEMESPITPTSKNITLPNISNVDEEEFQSTKINGSPPITPKPQSYDVEHVQSDSSDNGHHQETYF